MADEGQNEVLANFMAITSCEDTAVALNLLEATDWVLEEAVNLYLASEGGGGAGGGGGGAGASSRGRSSGPPGPDAFMHDDDDIRAPLPTKVERLFGDHIDPTSAQAMAAAAAARHGLGMSAAQAAQQQAAQQQRMLDVFRDFKAEGDKAAAGGLSAGPAGPSAPAPASATASGLSGLFAPPQDLLFNGTFEAAKTKAATEAKWLLVNIQAPSEFASHRLNRDTWSHEALKDVVRNTFVFYQTSDGSPDGQRLLAAYRLAASSLPAVLVVDPVTGARLWDKSGYVSADRLMEDLVPFMDHGPMDAGAASLAQMGHKRKLGGTPPPAALGGGGISGGARGAMTEDEEMALAIAMSMGDEGPGGAGRDDNGGNEFGSGGGDNDDDLDEEEIWAKIRAQEAEQAAAAARKTPEQVMAEAEVRLPPEPADSETAACRVALRLPDGTRLQRRFMPSDPVSALFDLVTWKLPEAASGRKVSIAPAMPGAQPLTNQLQSLQEAGAAGAMLNVKFTD